MQIASVVRYLARVHFIMWDVHQDDVLVRRDGHVTFLDIFMGPCEYLVSTALQEQDLSPGYPGFG